MEVSASVKSSQSPCASGSADRNGVILADPSAGNSSVQDFQLWDSRGQVRVKISARAVGGLIVDDDHLAHFRLRRHRFNGARNGRFFISGGDDGGNQSFLIPIRAGLLTVRIQSAVRYFFYRSLGTRIETETENRPGPRVYCWLVVLFAVPITAKANPAYAGSPQEDFQLTLDGKPAQLSDLRGKVVILNFWASGARLASKKRPRSTRCRTISRPLVAPCSASTRASRKIKLPTTPS